MILPVLPSWITRFGWSDCSLTVKSPLSTSTSLGFATVISWAMTCAGSDFDKACSSAVNFSTLARNFWVFPRRMESKAAAASLTMRSRALVKAW